MKRALLLTVLTVAVLAIAVAPALAEGYNDGGYNYTTKIDEAGYGDNAGIYVRSVEGTNQEQSFQGPHGGYTTTTNKCQDCHSTHYATGSYMLLRSNSREDACTFCHAGGGGSSLNIQMDNAYNIDGVIASDGNYRGTGHTLGYSGMAPADIEPAFQDTAGLACFSCHTPHGNSARVMEAFGSPSRPAGDGYVDEVVGVSFMATQMFRIQEQLGVVFDWNDFNGFTGQAYPEGSYMPIPEDLTQLPHDMDGAAILKWTGAPTSAYDIVGVSPTIQAELGDLNTSFNNWAGNGMSPSAPEPADMMAWRMNPANFTGDMNGYAMVNDTGVNNLFALFGVDGTAQGWYLVNLFMDWKVYWGSDLKVGNINTFFLNMGDWQITDTDIWGNPTQGYGMVAPPQIETWVKPLFPKGRFLLLKNPDTGDDYDMASGGVNEFGMPSPDFKTASIDQTASAEFGKKVAIDWEWPLGPAATWGPYFYTDSNERFPLAFPWAPKGVAMENEMCTSCHDGAAGVSSQKATVWLGEDSGFGGGYITAYSHDSNNRGCARAQYLNPEDDNNFGPHCANCHTGASGCWTCHSEDGGNWNGGNAYDPNTVLTEGASTYYAPASVKASAIVVDYQCIDGGFSYPHRTLGANLLKDALYGVDFDGTPVGPGEPRSASTEVTGAAGLNFGDAYFAESWHYEDIAGQNAHNLDSVCIDCHGDSTYWNGDDSSIYASFTSVDPLTYGWTTPRTWTVEGYDLLLKGLP